MSNTRITFQDETITEYEDGTEEVRFSDAEWAEMEKRPRYFGLCLPCGHALSAAWGDGTCGTCEGLMDELQHCETEEEADALFAASPRAPADVEVN